MDFKGKVTAVMKPKNGITKTGKEWANQDIVVSSINERYESSYCVTISKEHIDMFTIGDIVNISFDGQAQQSQNGDRWFNSLRAWKIEKIGTMTN